MKKQIKKISAYFIIVLLLGGSSIGMSAMTTGALQPWGPTDGEGWLLLPKKDAEKISRTGYLATGWNSRGEVVQYRKYKGKFGTIVDDNGKVWWAINFFEVEPGKPSSFDGFWRDTWHTHSGCIPFIPNICGTQNQRYKTYKGALNISTDLNGKTTTKFREVRLEGTVTGNKFSFQMYWQNGTNPYGSGEFTLTDNKHFLGTFEDDAGHRGTWEGWR